MDDARRSRDAVRSQGRWSRSEGHTPRGTEADGPVPLTFAVVGAPKAGTTSLAAYLADHPHVFMTDPKEPYFFGSDLAPLRRRGGIDDLEDYRRLFRRFDQTRHLAAGEASTHYLSSPDALQQLLEMRPGARLIVLVRDPVEMAWSFFHQQRRHQLEPRTDFAAAWRDSVRGVPVEVPTLVPRLLRYDQVVKLGQQLEQLSRVCPREQLFVTSLDQLAGDPRGTYRAVLAFIGVPDDGRESFDVENAAVVPRSQLAYRLMLSRPGRVASRRVKAAVGAGGRHALRHVRARALERPAGGQELSDDLAAEIRSDLHADLQLLSRLWPTVSTQPRPAWLA